MHVGVREADLEAEARRQRDREVRGDRRLADAALARRDRDHVAHAREAEALGGRRRRRRCGGGAGGERVLLLLLLLLLLRVRCGGGAAARRGARRSRSEQAAEGSGVLLPIPGCCRFAV